MKSFFLAFFFFFYSLVLSGQNISLLQEIKQDSAVDLYLALDWKELEKNKKEKAFCPAKVNLETLDGDPMAMNVKVRTRGHMRLDICSFPPIKLKFDKSDLSDHDLAPLNEMDLVHHCHTGDQYDQYLLKEYMAYKLFELISPYSFHVQLVRLHYLNPGGDEAHKPTYAFLVEHPEELASRLHGKENNNAIISKNAIEREPFLKVCLFQFMIGNTDWYIPSRHNLEFFGIPPNNLLVAIPFDFDYSGLVSTPYAVHHETLNLSSVSVRYYQGWCHTPEEVANALKVFRDQKEKILDMSNHIQGFNERSIKQTRDYLEEFFDIIENPKKLENQIIEHCDMWPVK